MKRSGIGGPNTATWLKRPSPDCIRLHLSAKALERARAPASNNSIRERRRLSPASLPLHVPIVSQAFATSPQARACNAGRRLDALRHDRAAALRGRTTRRLPRACVLSRLMRRACRPSGAINSSLMTGTISSKPGKTFPHERDRGRDVHGQRAVEADLAIAHSNGCEQRFARGEITDTPCAPARRQHLRPWRR